MAWQAFWLDGWEAQGTDWGLPLADAVALVDGLAKAARTRTPDAAVATDGQARAAGTRRADIAAVGDGQAKSAVVVLDDDVAAAAEILRKAIHLGAGR